MLRKPAPNRTMEAEWCLVRLDVCPHLNAWVSCLLLNWWNILSHILKLCGFPSKMWSLVNIVRNNCSFVPWQTVPSEGSGVSSEYSSTQNLFIRFKMFVLSWFEQDKWRQERTTRSNVQYVPCPTLRTAELSSCSTSHQNKSMKFSFQPFLYLLVIWLHPPIHTELVQVRSPKTATTGTDKCSHDRRNLCLSLSLVQSRTAGWCYCTRTR